MAAKDSCLINPSAPMACAALLPLAWAWADRDVGHEITYAWSGMPSLILKGERHTGTHFLRAVLKHNFPDEFQTMHMEPTLAREDCPTQQPFASEETSCCWVHGLADDRCAYHPPVSRCQPRSAHSCFLASLVLRFDAHRRARGRSRPLSFWCATLTAGYSR